MTSVDYGKGKHYYMDNRLYQELEVIHQDVNLRDMDNVFLVDGAERSGKSVLAMQLACRLDPTMTIDRVCFSAEEFERVVRFETKKGQAVIYDEAYDSLNSRSSLSSISQTLITLMTEMGQKNLFVFIVLPSIHLLQTYVGVFRSKGLFHVYTKGSQRGFWCFFNYDKKKALYLNGKKFFSYSGKGIPNTRFRGRFYNQYPLNEEKYREKKKVSLDQKWSQTTKDKNKHSENVNKLLYFLNKNAGYSLKSLEEQLPKVDFKLKSSAMANRINKAKDQLSNSKF